MELRLEYHRRSLGEFLRAKRQSLKPGDVGLAMTSRRRTQGLRREEVAQLAGVGLTWYTWAEQGRDIKVSNGFLKNLARALKLDHDEQCHLFQLAGQYPETPDLIDQCTLPVIIRQLLDDLTLRPGYVMNLNWDISGWNTAGNFVFAFDNYDPQTRNMLWMLFADTQLSERILEWDTQAPLMVASFRRDYARLSDRTKINRMISCLEQRSLLFKRLWNKHNVQGKCYGTRTFHIVGIGNVPFDHKTLIADDEKQLRLVYYAAQSTSNLADIFHKAVVKRSG